MPSDDNGISYGYSTNPRAAPTSSLKRSKYRNEDETPLTLMSDPRVVRGSTSALAKKVAAANIISNNNNTLKNSINDKSKNNENNDESTSSRPTYRFDVMPNIKDTVDLSIYLTQQDDLPPIMNDVSNQTDNFLHRPPTPEYVPRKTGIDNSTQVEDTTELFKFDLEVIPLVNVIVEKTLQQALFELSSEEELLGLKKQAEVYHEANKVEEEWMKQQEKETYDKLQLQRSKVKDLDAIKQHQVQVRTYVAGIQMMHQITTSIIDNIANELYDSNTWQRPERTEVEQNCLDPSIQEATLKFKLYIAAKEIIDEIIGKANDKYESVPYKAPPMARQIIVKLLIPAAQSDAIPAGDDAVDGEQADATAGMYIEVGPIRISDTDTLISTDILLWNEIKRKNVNLPDFKVKNYIVEALGGRAVADDACLLNFPLPDELTIILPSISS